MHRVAAFGPQELQLGGCLDTLGDDLEIQVMTERDDGADDRGVVRVGADVGDERAVDLQRVQREALQIVQRAVTGAEVIDRERKPEFLQRQQRAPPRFGVLHEHPFGELELEQRGG